jgi:Glycosyl transferase family 11
MITHKSIGYSGRLGNQLFQYATLYSLAKSKNFEFGLPSKNLKVNPHGCLDMSSNKWISYRLDLLDCFDLNVKLLSDTEISIITKNYLEKSFEYDGSINDITDDTSIDGYFQSEQYFNDYKNELINHLVFKSHIVDSANAALNKLPKRKTVSVHIRRGDYVNNTTLDLLSSEYFVTALDFFTDNDYNFLIVSDDIEWCKSTFQTGDNLFFSEKNSQFVDLCILSKCDHNIISNSTFSWWGAWLNKNQDKRIIAPKKWFKRTDINTNTLIPENWIII